MDFTGTILRKLQDCPLLKEHGVTALGFAGMDAKKRSMSILNTKGELVIERYCDGSCDMQYPFALIYRSPEIDTAGKLAAQELIDDVAEWLTDEDNLPKVEGVQVQKISRADTCALISEDEDGATFQGSFALEYYK
ncbi:MAG: hypothetical protein K2N56_10040, partial [Oscillospiraceae bacterium]|nr:hypothetical protein [Oscillospiraceae bacterium]